MSIYQTLKKYVFLLSIFFIILTSVHLVVVYIYEGSTLSPKEGGTASVGFVGQPPSLNPATYGMDSTNDYILRFMYHSLLRYNIETRQMEGDLANCNLGKDFSSIKCYLKSNYKWSDGTPVTKDDVITTYNLLKESDFNKPAKSILANITVKDQGDYIEFSGKADILILDIFLYPIMKNDMADKIDNDQFSLSTYPTDGPYTFEKKEPDDRYGSTNISIVKNPDSKDSAYLSKYIFKFFGDKNALLANKDAINIVFPNDTIDSIPSPRFTAYNYLLPQYVGLFLNSEKIGGEMRNLVLFQAGNAEYKNLDTSKGQTIHDPFFGTGNLTPTALANKNIATTLGNLGYYKKEALVGELAKASTKPVIETTAMNQFFNSPTARKSYATGSGEILLSGNVPDGVTGVYVNDYRLKSFTTGSKKFYFRAGTALGTMVEGKNVFNLTFEVGGKRIYKESMIVYYSADPEAVKKYESASNAEVERAANAATAANQKETEDKKKLGSKVDTLDARWYYNKNLEPFILHLSYTTQAPYMKSTAETIQASLQSLGINVELKELANEDVQAIITNGDKNYDMILTGINLGLFDYNLFPFFHSGQANKGFNFSKVKNIALDILLEKLKSSQINSDSLKHIQSETLDILKKENVFLPLYSPYHTFFIDKNLKDTQMVPVIPYSSSLYDIGEHMYIKEDRHIDWTKKGLLDGLNWIKSHTPFMR